MCIHFTPPPPKVLIQLALFDDLEYRPEAYPKYKVPYDPQHRRVLKAKTLEGESIQLGRLYFDKLLQMAYKPHKKIKPAIF
jgi:hypothetical protein